MFKRKIKELEIGDRFWFSGMWRHVIAKDDKYLYYGIGYAKKGKKVKVFHKHTIMVNSLMIVETKDDGNKVNII